MPALSAFVRLWRTTAGGAGPLRVIRGSSWRHSAVTELRLAFRDYGDVKRNDLGFRIARYAQ